MSPTHGTWDNAVKWLLNQPECRQLVCDCYYDYPRTLAAERYFTSDEWSEVRVLLPATTGLALDVGSGHGITAYALARCGWQVTAIEPDAGEIVGREAIRRLAADSGLAIEVCDGTGERVPSPDAHYELILARQVLHHAHDLRCMAREFFRVMRPGGTLITLRDHVISGPSQMQKFLDSHPLNWLYGGEHAFTLGEYREALSTAGFEIVRVFRAFDSAVNYAPHTRESLRAELLARARAVPFGPALLGLVLRNANVFSWMLRTLSWLDRRAGRLVSFVCRKPSTV